MRRPLLAAGDNVLLGCPWVSGSARACFQKFVNMICYKPLAGKFHQIYNFAALGDKHQLIRF